MLDWPIPITAIRARAAALDEAAAFPAEDMALLRSLGLLTAPLPRRLGGHGAGTEAEGAAAIFGLLRSLGAANPSVGRLFEAHVNAIRLITRYGSQAQAAAAAEACRAGDMFGLWVTDAPGAALTLDGGSKGPCSGAGHVPRALVTVTLPSGAVRLAAAALTGTEPMTALGTRLLGMRASANGVVDLTGVALDLLGEDGDYLREPDFSAGAWRTMAVTLGVLDSLVETVRDQLRARGHDQAPLQQARLGEMLIAQGTAGFWTWHAAQAAEAAAGDPAEQVATVNLARIAVETACLAALQHAQRALGLAAMVRPNPAERILRDLTTYLRQPAPDMVLTEAAQHALSRP